MKIIIINGMGGVGKGKFVKYCSNIIKNGESYATDSIINPIKRIARKEFNWDGSKDDKSRKFLADLKELTDGYNNYSMNFLINNIIEEAEFLNYYFIDMRSPEDIDYLKTCNSLKNFNIITVIVRRPEIERYYGNKADDNVFNYQYDYVIENNGTLEDLRATAELFMEVINNE